MSDSPLVRVLTGHWLAGVGRDHATRRFRVRCACGQVEFGWHPSIGAAVQTWIAHVVTLVAAEGRPTQRAHVVNMSSQGASTEGASYTSHD